MPKISLSQSVTNTTLVRLRVRVHEHRLCRHLNAGVHRAHRRGRAEVVRVDRGAKGASDGGDHGVVWVWQIVFGL